MANMTKSSWVSAIWETRKDCRRDYGRLWNFRNPMEQALTEVRKNPHITPSQMMNRLLDWVETQYTEYMNDSAAINLVMVLCDNAVEFRVNTPIPLRKLS